MWFGREMDHECCGEEGTLVTEVREEHTQGIRQGKQLTRKTRGADLLGFLQPVGLEDWSFRGLRHG